MITPALWLPPAPDRFVRYTPHGRHDDSFLAIMIGSRAGRAIIMPLRDHQQIITCPQKNCLPVGLTAIRRGFVGLTVATPAGGIGPVVQEVYDSTHRVLWVEVELAPGKTSLAKVTDVSFLLSSCDQI
jgi:hypothetical protein